MSIVFLVVCFICVYSIGWAVMSDRVPRRYYHNIDLTILMLTLILVVLLCLCLVVLLLFFLWGLVLFNCCCAVVPDCCRLRTTLRMNYHKWVFSCYTALRRYGIVTEFYQVLCVGNKSHLLIVYYSVCYTVWMTMCVFVCVFRLTLEQLYRGIRYKKTRVLLCRIEFTVQ